MAKGQDERHNPKRKVSKKVDEVLRSKAWFKWQLSGQVGMGIDDGGAAMNEAIEGHYQELLNEHFENKGK